MDDRIQAVRPAPNADRKKLEQLLDCFHRGAFGVIVVCGHPRKSVEVRRSSRKRRMVDRNGALAEQESQHIPSAMQGPAAERVSVSCVLAL